MRRCANHGIEPAGIHVEEGGPATTDGDGDVLCCKLIPHQVLGDTVDGEGNDAAQMGSSIADFDWRTSATAPAIAARQPVYSNTGSARLSWIDTRDIADVAVAAE